MNTYRYAAYGSNLHPQRLQKRVRSATLIGNSFLPDYSLRFHKRSDVDGSGKCSILVGGPGVHVAVFEIAERERRELDRIEGVGGGYETREILVDGFGVCSTYIAAPSSIDDSLAPVDWYREYVLRGARFNRFPAGYIAFLEQVRAVRDADGARADREWQLIEKLSVPD